MSGTLYGHDRNFYWKQTNNAVEYIGRALKAELGNAIIRLGVAPSIVKEAGAFRYLESCGGGGIANCSGAVRGPKLPDMKKLFGWSRLYVSLDDVIMCFLSNPDNADLMRQVIPGFNGTHAMENRFPRLHQVAARYLFGVRAEFMPEIEYTDIKRLVLVGCAVTVHLKGHFTSAVDWNTATDEGVQNDSWGDRKPEWHGDGFNRPLTFAEWADGHKDVTVYYPD